MSWIRRALRYLARNLVSFGYHLFLAAITQLPYFHFVRGTANTQNPISLSMWFVQKILGINRKAYWPVHFTSRINLPENVYVGVDCAPGFEPGCYIQAIHPIIIGDYTQVASNVGIIAANHNVYDLREHTESLGVVVGNYCWLGMGCVILPGVKLGDFTVVGANAVVSRSFPEGHCVIAGVPARKIRDLEPEKCVRHEVMTKYHGYIRERDFCCTRQSAIKQKLSPS